MSILRLKLGVCLLAALALGAGCKGDSDKPSGGGSQAAGGGKRVIILTNGTSPFWDAGRAGMESAATEFNLADAGLQAIMDTNDGTAKRQVDRLRQYANDGDVAAVAISVTEEANAAIHRELRNLQKKGVKIITVDSDVDRNTARDTRFAYLGTDNEIAGQELGKAAKVVLPEGGKYATFVGLTGAANAKARSQGFQSAAGDTFVLAENLGDLNDESKARSNVRDALNRNADLKMLVGIWSYDAPAIAAIIDDPKVTFRKDGGKVVVFDADPRALPHLEKGTIDVMLVQNPYEMGRSSVRLMKALVTDDQETLKEMFPNQGQPDGDFYNTGLKVVAPDQGSPLTKELFGAGTEYLTYSEFKKWLNQYNLTGS